MIVVEAHKSLRRLGYRARGRTLLRSGINVIELPLTRNEVRMLQQLERMHLVRIMDPRNPEDAKKLDDAKVAFFHEAHQTRFVEPGPADEGALEALRGVEVEPRPMRRRRVRKVKNPGRRAPTPMAKEPIDAFEADLTPPANEEEQIGAPSSDTAEVDAATDTGEPEVIGDEETDEGEDSDDAGKGDDPASAE